MSVTQRSPSAGAGFIGDPLHGVGWPFFNKYPVVLLWPPLLVLGHLSVGRLEIGAHYVWTNYFLNKSNNFSGADGLVETIIDLFINAYG